MKLLIGMILCAVISVVTSSFNGLLTLSGTTISTLYTISGIMFSIGMSLVITSNTSEIKNRRIKLLIREKINAVRNHYLVCFAVISLMYILLYSKVEFKYPIQYITIYKEIVLNYADLLVVTMAYSICYFTKNFLSQQKLNTQIEDAE